MANNTFGTAVSRYGGSIVPGNDYDQETADKVAAQNAKSMEQPKQTTLAEDQARAANQGKAGYDILGNPIESSSSGVRRYTSEDPLAMEKPAAFTEADAEAIRENTRKEMAARIDAIDQRYVDLVASDTAAANNREGQARAMRARSGIIGSPRGAAQGEKVVQYNKALSDQRSAEKNLEIQAVYDRIDSRADQAIKDARAKAEKDSADYLAFLKERRDQAREDIKTLGAAGTNFADMDPADIEELKKDSGIDSDFLLESYLNAYRPKESQIKYDFKTVGNKIFGYGVDPKTGKLSTVQTDMPFTVPENYKTVATDDGRFLFVPDEFDPTKSLDEQIKVFGSKNEYSKPVVKKTTGGLNDSSISDLSRSDPEFYAKVIKGSKGGKPPAQGERQALTKAFNVINQVEQLQSAIKDEDTGPITGIIRSNNPYDTKAQKIQAQLTAIVPNLARGVYGEVGVLTDNDVRLYSSTLPNLKSTEDVRKAILGATLRSVLNSIETQLETSAASGLDVSGFESKYRDIKNRVQKIEDSIGIVRGADGEASDELTQAAEDAGYEPSDVQELRDQGYSDEDILALIESDSQ